jgi:hypothetical protein
LSLIRSTTKMKTYKHIFSTSSNVIDASKELKDKTQTPSTNAFIHQKAPTCLQTLLLCINAITSMAMDLEPRAS